MQDPLKSLERLLIDTDVKFTIQRYLEVVGFDVRMAKDSKVDVRDDVAVVKYARRYHRVLVCHDRHKDKPKDRLTRIRLRKEIFNHGGHVLEVAGPPEQPVLTSVGKILAHHETWSAFFQANDGIVTVYNDRLPRMVHRKELLDHVQSSLSIPEIPPVSPLAPSKLAATRKLRRIPPEQLPPFV